jgi:hypothetical protein
VATSAKTDRIRIVPDGDGQLGQGLVVQAGIVAHLMGIRLLTLDAEVLLLPAQAISGRDHATGTAGTLGDATRLLDESEAVLAELRRAEL